MLVLLAFMGFALSVGLLFDRIDAKEVGAILAAALLVAGIYFAIPRLI